MLSKPRTHDGTPSKKPIVKVLFHAWSTPYTPPLTPIHPEPPAPSAGHLSYDCDSTGDYHKDNHLRFSELVELSVELATIFQQLPSDYSGVSIQQGGDVSIAQHLLQRDIKKYRERISSNTADSGRTERVKRNTVLRALILFSLGGIHATQYLERNADDRIEWLIQLNTSGVWI